MIFSLLILIIQVTKVITFCKKIVTHLFKEVVLFTYLTEIIFNRF
jgi:hypothetical protein